MYINQHVLSGRVGGDATLRSVNGKSVLGFRFAHSSPFGDKRTTWYNVSLWGNQADYMASKIRKGMELIVVGASDAREYEDKNGNPRVSQEFNATSVQFVVFPQDTDDETESVDETVDAAAIF